MREHPIDRLAVAERLGPPGGGDPTAETLLDSRPPVVHFGRYWTEQIVRGYRGVRRLNADQYSEIRFDDLCADPERTLQAIAEFFDLPTHGDDWIARAVPLARGALPSLFDKLSPTEQRDLAEACRAGMLLLGRTV